jgi:hypothetical protein
VSGMLQRFESARRLEPLNQAVCERGERNTSQASISGSSSTAAAWSSYENCV